MARVREFQRMADGSWRITVDGGLPRGSRTRGGDADGPRRQSGGSGRARLVEGLRWRKKIVMIEHHRGGGGVD
eukprot:SAG11_NODE_25332_length_360_cov_0.793103_2_plen_73_part_00